MTVKRSACGVREIVGSRGVALDALDPVGTVRVAGEIWRAQRIEGSPPIKEGDEVRVFRRDGYVLHCEVPGGRRL